jgi:SpoVK/Ycf46/Vps4 family AAA+-type ATPase
MQRASLTQVQEDSVFFASTNYPDRLDPALLRPGRFDVHVALHHAVHSQAVDLYKHFYPLSRSHDDTPINIAEKNEEQSTSHPFKSQTDLDRAAEQFADQIMSKDIKVSIATIQGYLLMYKKDPVKALDNVDEWAQGIKNQQSSGSEEVTGKQDVEEKELKGEILIEQKVSESEVEVEAQEKNAEKHEAEKQEIGELSEKQEVVQEVVLA